MSCSSVSTSARARQAQGVAIYGVGSHSPLVATHAGAARAAAAHHHRRGMRAATRTRTDERRDARRTARNSARTGTCTAAYPYIIPRFIRVLYPLNLRIVSV